MAHRCSETGDVPVGALVLTAEGEIIGEGRNRREAEADPTAHAEIIALRAAGKARGSWNLSGCTLVVTLEPCTMCAGAAVAARVDRVVFGAWDEKAGACGSVRDVVRDTRLNHQIEVIGGVMQEETSIQLRGFFAEKRMENEHKNSPFWQKQAASSAPEPTVAEEATPVGAAEAVTATPLTPPVRRRSDQHRHRIIVPPLQTD